MIVVMPCYGRPEYLERTLEAWTHVRSLEHVPWVFVVDPHPHAAVRSKVNDLMEDFTRFHPTASIQVNDRRLGLNTNIHWALDGGLEHSDFVILAEDDVVPAADALEFFHWASWELEDSPVGAVCAFNELEEPEPTGGRAAFLTDGPGFRPWLWGTWISRWKHFRNGWDFDNSKRGWDVHLGNDQIPDSPWPWVARPVLSRSDHIGEHGEHMYPEAFVNAQAPSFDPEGEEQGRWTLLPSQS